ncbi:serpin B3-like isoform X2 [Crotalus tigris]|nr:serpin B3-like isoform X2 [Crotalus tigris]XP_039175615.1 serpin B3-like isoform X2 [Crotalus tigris]XP_039175616.1 serpin B3-like isoform X2 [Crotalus tigris]
MDSLVEANNRFSMDFFKSMEEERSNRITFFSPFSFVEALAMVLFGARGNTALEIEKVLHFDKITGSRMSTNGLAQCDKPGGLHNQFKELLSAINQPAKNYTLSIANRLYGSDIYEFLQQFTECTKELYHAELERVDFVNVEETRKKINSWVESQTNGKIKELFAPHSIGKNTAMILVNAIYFKGKWKCQFNSKETHEADFWTSKEQSKKVQMMAQTGRFNYAKITNPPMEVLEFPYDKGILSMYIFLPDKNGTTQEIVKQLSYEKFQEWTSSTSMQVTKITIFLPKFKVEEEYALIPTLKKMGIKDVFIAHKADLSGISESPDLVVSEFRHKACIEVNEEGTEAAAATDVVTVPTSAQTIPKFNVNRPILFIIKHNSTKCILFAGKFFSP